MTSVAHAGQNPFFHRQQTKNAIRHHAKTNDVALFVGAGVSVDQGLPTWAQLV
jgi:NAD-dependent SIR2 family protein deacetylase